jgi:hypothetical protein
VLALPIDAQLSEQADLRRMMRVNEIVCDLQQNLRILVLDSGPTPLRQQSSSARSYFSAFSGPCCAMECHGQLIASGKDLRALDFLQSARNSTTTAL